MSRFLSDRLRGLEAYVPGEQPQDKKYIKLNTNESPYPISEKTALAARAELARLNFYPDPECTVLREKIASRLGLKKENVVPANGSDEILSFIFMAFCDEKRPVVFPDITYGFYSVFARLYGVPYTEIPLSDDFTVDCSRYFGINRNIVIANPNAPTGIEISLEDIETMLKTNPDSIVVIDEAYVDFGGTSAVGLLSSYDNLIVVQTYSKSKSAAGLRLGYALASEEVAADLNMMRYSTNPYNIDRLALALGAAIQDDVEYYEEKCRTVADTREKTTERLNALGFETTASRTNFIFARHPEKSGGELYGKLKERGILVRHFDKPRLSDHLRITVGTPEEMDALITELGRLISDK